MAKSKRPNLTANEQDVLDHLQVRLMTSAKDKARCDKLIVEHHYLKDATLVGEQLRYVATYKGQWLALATWFEALATCSAPEERPPMTRFSGLVIERESNVENSTPTSTASKMPPPTQTPRMIAEIIIRKKAKEEDYCSMCVEFCALRFSESISKKIK